MPYDNVVRTASVKSSQCMLASMTFVKTECPECGETVILDVVNGYGYCMYCGGKVEPEGLRRLPSPLRFSLIKELRSEDSLVSEPWFDDVHEAVRLMLSGDADAASAIIVKVYGSVGEGEERARISSALELEALEAIASVIDGNEAEPYRGGLLDLSEVMKEFDDVYPSDVINICMMQMTIGKILDADSAKSILVTLFYLARDALVLTRGVAETKDLLGQICAISTDVAVAAYPVPSDADKSEESARCFKFLIDLWDMLSVVSEGMTQKDLVKVNRTLSSTGYGEVLEALGEAFSKAGDAEGGYQEAMQRYVLLVCGILSSDSRKAGKRSKARSPPSETRI